MATTSADTPSILATQATKQVGAEAFQAGQNIVLGEKAAAQTQSGDMGVLAHEATHVAQEQKGEAERTTMVSSLGRVRTARQAASEAMKAEKLFRGLGIAYDVLAGFPDLVLHRRS